MYHVQVERSPLYGNPRSKYLISGSTPWSLKTAISGVAIAIIVSTLITGSTLPGFAGTDEDAIAGLKVEDASTGQTSATVLANEEFSFKVQMDDDLHGVAGMQFDLVFGNMCQGEPAVTLGDSWDIKLSSLKTGLVKAVFAMATQDPPGSGMLATMDGPLDLMQVSCTVADVPSGTVFEVSIDGLQVSDADVQPMNVETEALTVTVNQLMKGDVNVDGSITADDYNLVLSYIADPVNNPLSDSQLWAADVSPAKNPDQGRETCGNGTVNIFDSTAITNAVNSGDPVAYIAARC
jgi:hypothetical protein